MTELYQGDCIEVMQTIPSKTVDCIVTSPPYWKGFEYEAYFNSYAQYLEWCEAWLKECKRVLKKNGTLWLNVINDSEITIRAFEIMDIATRRLMYKLHETVIWYRYNQQPANTKRQLTNQCEYIFCLRHTSAGVEFNKASAYEQNPTLFKTKNVGNVWELPFNSGKQNNISFGRRETKAAYGHSGFPVQLPETCILLSTKEGDTVLDLFMGTGTTGVACKKHGRNFIGIDMDENAFRLAKERIEQTEPRTEKPKIRKRIDKPFRAVWLDDDHNEIGTPQTESVETMSCQECKHYEVGKPCKPFLNECDCHYEPQTDCAWQNDEYIPTELASTMLKERFKEQK